MSSKVCRFAGCAAGVVRDDLCAVHLDPAGGKFCETCHGTGKHFYSGHNLTMACQRCGGIGLKDAKTSTRIPNSERVPVDERDLMKKFSE